MCIVMYRAFYSSCMHILTAGLGLPPLLLVGVVTLCDGVVVCSHPVSPPTVPTAAYNIT